MGWLFDAVCESVFVCLGISVCAQVVWCVCVGGGWREHGRVKASVTVSVCRPRHKCVVVGKWG